MIFGDSVWRGIAPLQDRPRPLWKGYHKKWASDKLLKDKSVLFGRDTRYELPAGYTPLPGRLEGGAFESRLPPCNAYGLQDTEFLDPLPAPRSPSNPQKQKEATRPNFGDCSPYEVWSSDEERMLKDESGAQPPACSSDPGATQMDAGDTLVEPRPDQQVPPTAPEEPAPSERREPLPSPLLPTRRKRASLCRMSLWTWRKNTDRKSTRLNSSHPV